MKHMIAVSVWAATALWAASAGAQPSAEAPAPPSASDQLILGCDGLATVQQSQSTTATVFNNRGDSATGSATTYGQERVPAHLDFELQGSTGRIHIPKALVPPINSGGADGWWTLTELNVGENEITGRFRINFLNKPSFRIDRVTGAVEMQGFARSGFAGKCAREDRTKRAF